MPSQGPQHETVSYDFDGILFEWDRVKAALNVTKHGVSFSEGATVFGDAHGVMILDPDHSDDESRFLLVGRSQVRRLLVVVALERGQRIRLIRARAAERRRGCFMKKDAQVETEEMRAEYDFSEGKRNRYASRYASGTNLVLIEPELFMAFPGEQEVNDALRLLLKAGAQAVTGKTHRQSALKVSKAS